MNCFYILFRYTFRKKGYQISKFSDLKLSEDMINNLNTLSYTEMTEIQEKSLSHIIQNRDVIAQAKTGSGKTAAFGIGLINKLNVKKFRIQSVILCPTRELADQVAKELRRIARCTHNVKILTLCGGVPFGPQINSLFHGAHILVGTPGRVLKHLKEKSMNLNDVDTLVLDEADRMLDMGFQEDIDEIIEYIPKERQTLLFSATFQEEIKQMSSHILIDPIIIKAESSHDESTIKEYFFESENKTSLIPAILSTYKPKSVVIFCNMKISCNELSNDLCDLGFDTLVLHSDFEQKERDETLTLFANKSYPILIATDVAARGLDIKDVDVVLNYDIANDPEVHVHRVGRTARAGKSGVAVTLFNAQDEDKFENIRDYTNNKCEISSIDILKDDLDFKLDSDFRTLFINGGKKNKVRAGDLLGALIQGVGLEKDDIGKIDIFEFCSYVAIKKDLIDKAFDGLTNGKIKGKYFRIFQK